MGEGDWPKSDGDVLYASETNMLYNIVPIGAILPWAKSITGVPALPSNFVECSGQVLSDADSPINGQTIPNLNGDARFLYGAATSGGTKTEDYLPNHKHSLLFGRDGTSGEVYGYDGGSPAWNSSGVSNTTSGTAWVGYAVVYIMRVK